jgi:hypothetical protein
VNIAANPVEVFSSRVVGVHSRDLLLQLKPRVKDDQLALEFAAQEFWDARVNAE